MALKSANVDLDAAELLGKLKEGIELTIKEISIQLLKNIIFQKLKLMVSLIQMFTMQLCK